MEKIKFVKEYDHLGTKYRFTYHEFANLIEWEELVKLKWYQRLFRNDSHEWVWKRIYFGHIEPLNKCVDTFWCGNKIKNV